MTHEIFTTHVGSLPRPHYLLEAFSVYNEGKMPQEEFEKILDIALRAAVKMQVETGIDEVNDGEYRRSVFFGDLTSLPGFFQNVFPLEFSAGDVYRSPLVAGKIKYDVKRPLSASEVRTVKDILKSLNVEKKVKVTVPIPSFMAFFYPDPNNPMVPPQFKQP